ncbi:MAG: hypothetical protein GF317_03955 [Candidatus Lokiarchaeota archaeon]|nr:hypothetical protein [Candidatus Lokiarchaeota archaeon]MBD3199040.1 hypothetical protein [Candidatus Lokiarchaeota archaeon]
MTELNNKEFLIRLSDIVAKLSSIAKTQSFRLKQKWDDYLHNSSIEPYLIRTIPIDKSKFVNDNKYRIEILNITIQALADGFHAIKTLLKTIYESYFYSELFINEFSEQDQLIIKYLVAKEILGNLIQYNKLDHETVPLKYNVVARNYSLIKLKAQKDKRILENMNKIFGNQKLELSTIQNILKEIEKDGLIKITKKDDNSNLYEIKNELILSDEGQEKYNQYLSPLIVWPTNLWRSFYNIRELNITPAQDIKNRETLEKILSRSATQGFSATNNVFQNLLKYYQNIDS